MSAMRFWIALLAVACVACTERNPAYCGDGTCIDPSKPFCDIDGTVGGSPGTCIAVSCMPGEFAACRGDNAITCSSGGNNYDVVQCQFGCEAAASGCRECTSNSQCSTGLVCDPSTSHCGQCKTDDECDNMVCDSGVCLDQSAIVYASPSGTGTCSLAQPCSTTTAVVTAENRTPTPIVRLLPGNYTKSITFDVPTAAPLRVVATGANIVVIGSTAAIVAEAGASVDVRNLSSTSERQVQCGLASTSAPLSKVILRDATLAMVGSGLAFEIQRCELDLSNVDLTTTVDVIGAKNDSTFRADRFYVHGSPTSVNTILPAGSHVTIDITNAVLQDTNIIAFLSDTAPGSSLRFAYTTFLLPQAQSLCSGTKPTYVTFAFENSIVAVNGASDAFSNPNPGNCSFTATILTRQTTALSGTTVQDPQFVDLAGADFHLKSTSPAIDAAAQGSINTNHDVAGTARPQGAASDIGAFEFRP